MTTNPPEVPPLRPTTRHTMKQDTTPAIFRRDRTHPKGVFVIFPYDPADRRGYDCTVFDPGSDHGGGDPATCVAMSRPADPDTEPDAAAVRRQLENAYGYTLRILKRVPKEAFARRRANLNPTPATI